MRIILRMAGITISGCTFIYAILVAGFTGDLDMFAHQFEVGQVMIELGWQPAIGRMTRRAVHPKATQMCVVIDMAGITIEGGTPVNPVHMAGLAGNFDMFAFQLEGSQVVIE